MWPSPQHRGIDAKGSIRDRGRGKVDSVLPLSRLRVLELGQLLAGPFAGHLLATFGAEVLKVEAPGQGDPMRRWGKMHGDTSLWWYSLGRGKQSMTCNLHHPQGPQVVRDLVAQGYDIVIENFRPGRMEAWGLGYEELERINPRTILVRISGYGQSGPYAMRPGFANIAEAFGGLRYITGEPGRAPVRSSVSLGDTLAGMQAAFATLAAVQERETSGRGQYIDMALYEAVFNVLESTLPEFDRFGHVRERLGTRLDGVVPSNTYPCADGHHVTIGANSDRLFQRLMQVIGRPDLAADPALAQNDGRVPQAQRIDDAITTWTRLHDHQDVLTTLEREEIPVGPINSIADLARDPHVAARGLLEPVRLPDGTTVKMPAVVPRLSRTPGESRWPGPRLGEHNDRVYRELLHWSQEQIEKMSREGML